MDKYRKIIFACIIFLAVTLRFWQLETNPPAISLDEVAWGYNAYAIGLDGKDEFGRFLPYDYFESFGDFKPPVYAYLDVLPVKLWGLTAFAVRFPSALFGVLTVIVTYFLVKRLFPKSDKKELYGLMGALVLAVSPWHIMLSRAAFEANVSTFFLATGIWLFLASVQNKKWYLIASAVSFVLSMYTFNTGRVVAPLFVLALAIGTYKNLLLIKKQVIIAVLVGVILLLPTMGFLLSPQASLRFKEVNIFSNLDIIKTSNAQIEQDKDDFISAFFHNRRFGFAHEYLKHYFDNLNPNFLFLEGDGNPRFSIQSVGQMYVWDALFLILGICYLFKNREGYWWFLPLWILLGIIPAATARETPHALRIETTLPAFQIIVAYGFVNFIFEVKRKLFGLPIRKIATILLFLLLLGSVYYFVHDYYTHYPARFSSQWQYGYKEAMQYAYAHQKEYDAVYVSQDLGKPYIYFVFHNRYDPVLFRKNAVVQRDVFGFVDVKQIEKFHFVTAFPPNRGDKKNLYIIHLNKNEEFNEKIPKNARVVHKINRIAGDIILVLYTL